MRFVLYTNALSEHQMPLAREIVKRIGAENFRYVYTGVSSQKFQESAATDEWIEREGNGLTSSSGSNGSSCCPSRSGVREWLENADVMLVGGIRPIELIKRRLTRGLTTCYMSERWFKPIGIGVDKRCRCRVELPGFLRLLVPGYRRMAKRFVKLFESPSYRFLPIGPWSKFDMLRMCKWFGQKVNDGRIVDWGDFVGPGVEKRCRCRKVGEPLRVLWVGRELAWKRVEDIERAVELVNKGVGSRDEGVGQVSFTKLTGVTMAEVRQAMREHDVYVLSSDATEGWGCVVNEALEEGMDVIGTFEAGASAAILPKERLYHAGDVKALARLLALEVDSVCGGEQRNLLPPCSIGEWTAAKAAERLLSAVEMV